MASWASTSCGAAAAAARTVARSASRVRWRRRTCASPATASASRGSCLIAFVGRDRGVEVVALDRVVRLLVQRRELGLGLRDGLRGALGLAVGALCRRAARHAVRLGRLEHLVEHGAHLLDGRRALEQRHRLALEDRDDGRHALDLERGRDLRVRLGIDPGQEEAAGVLVGQRAEVGAELRVRLVRRDPQEHDDRVLRRVLDELTERLVRDVDDVPARGGRAALLAGRG